MSIVPDRELVSENAHKKTKIEENNDHSWSYLRDLLPADLKYIVHDSLDYESLKSLCRVDKSWSKICGTDLGKKIMEKKFKEMVNKEFDRALLVFNIFGKDDGFGPFIKDKPGVQYVGIDKDGKTTTDIAIMWYFYPKYCVHIIKNGFTKDWNDKKHKVTSIEDVIAIHDASDKFNTNPNLCVASRNPVASLKSFSVEVGIIIERLKIFDERHKKIPDESMENLKNNPMDPCAWKRPSIRKAIGKSFSKVSFEEIMDAIFPDKLDQARAKHSIRFR